MMANPAALLARVLLLAVSACGASELPWYVGTSGAMLLPSGGGSLGGAVVASAEVGVYSSDFLAWEIDLGCAPNASTRQGHESLSQVAVRGLFHLSGVESFDRLFGCERFDPFVTFGGETCFGGRRAFAGDSLRTATGPTVGIGVFYHLSESLDLRVDGGAMLCCGSPCDMLYAVGIGLQWNFGGGGE